MIRVRETRVRGICTDFYCFLCSFVGTSAYAVGAGAFVPVVFVGSYVTLSGAPLSGWNTIRNCPQQEVMRLWLSW